MVLLADKRSFIGSNPRHTMNGDGNHEERFEMPRKIPCVQQQQGQTSPLDSNNIWYSHMGEFYFVQDDSACERRVSSSKAGKNDTSGMTKVGSEKNTFSNHKTQHHSPTNQPPKPPFCIQGNRCSRSCCS
ncbi:hypothetical protein OIU85_027144 [Salix viminalis]|uniref:Uncharacterized protein n=1 Tax=Salix viminalis TaxID=40686 RepID=A0A9Q0TAK9_SALVM|nr:hypothetical protein OIU85_027144 [Salix viminalis]